MHIAAIYIENHLIFNKPQLINFGGLNHFYLENDYSVNKINNKKYIPNFYSSKNITLVTALVGKNGSGKTSLLKLLIESIYSNYGSNAIIILEDANKVFIYNNLRNVTFNFRFFKLDFKINTIYYSPHLDFQEYKFGIDISFDSSVKKDLENINDFHKSNNKVDPVRNLKSNSWKRQIEFLNSDLGKNISPIFGISSNDFNKITFTRYLIEVEKETDKIKFWNTPNDFRKIIQGIYDKTRNEAKIINETRPKGYNLVSLQKNLLKNYFLMDFICLFIKLMEFDNSYLDEGHLKQSEITYLKENKFKTAYESFISFLKNHYYQFEGNKFQLLPVKETAKLLDSVFSFIDKSSANNEHDKRYFNWDDKAINLNKEDTIELLSLQNNFINKVNEYYRGNTKDLSDFLLTNYAKIKDFINFEPSSRILSSGENALLNLFAKFYEVYDKILLRVPKNNQGELFLVLLDEGDMGFHPEWKKKYVNSIILFFEHYFAKSKVEIQIIFTTHDPLTLSDILNYNIVYLNRSGNEAVLNDNERPNKSFGANITDLLADSFFIHNGLIGEFSASKINETIKWLRSRSKQNHNYHKMVIENIDEPLVQRRLSEMYSEKMKDDYYKKQLENEIKILSDKIKKM